MSPGLRLAIIAATVAVSGCQLDPGIADGYPPLPGPSPTLEAVAVSTDIASSNRPVDEKDSIVLVGLFDLLLGHPSRAAFADFVSSYLDRTQSIDLYRFVVNSIVAGRDPTLIALLRRSDWPRQDSPKGKVLREALGLIRA